MLLIEGGGKRLLYSGDFRRHGGKSALVDRIMRSPPGDLDLLIIEGANLGTDKPAYPESKLEEEFLALFRRTRGRVFVNWSGQNIDRTVTPITLHSSDICEQFYEAHLVAISILPVFVATIDPALSVHLNPEHSEYRWVSFNDACRMVPFAGQRKVLQHVEAEFMLRAPSHHLKIKVA